ncbi:MAG: tetratricopeptide repeat protein, partial [Phycisphaerae bacterium]
RHRILLARTYEAAGQTDLAISELRAVLDADPDATIAVQELIGVLGRAKRYVEEETLIRQYMSRQPDNPRWPMALGRLGETQGDLKKAWQGYRQAVKVSHYDPAAVDAMLGPLERTGQNEQIVKVVQQLIPPQRQNALTDAWLASALYRLGRKDEALARYDQALSRASSSYGLMRSVLVNMRAALGLKQTIAQIRRRLAASPDSTALEFALATVLELDGQYAEAIRLVEPLTRAETSQPLRLEYLSLLASLLHGDRQLEQAAATYRRVLQINPDSRFALNNLAYLLAEDLNRPQEALPYARRAFQISRDDPNVVDTLGWVECLMGRYDRAIGTLRSAIELNPEFVPAIYHLGEAYRRRGDAGSAKLQFQKALELCKATGDRSFLGQIEAALKSLQDSGS